MPALKRIEQEPAMSAGKHDVLERIYALHQESTRDHARLSAGARQRPDYALLDRPLELSDWHPLNGPQPTD